MPRPVGLGMQQPSVVAYVVSCGAAATARAAHFIPFASTCRLSPTGYTACTRSQAMGNILARWLRGRTGVSVTCRTCSHPRAALVDNPCGCERFERAGGASYSPFTAVHMWYML